MEAKLVNLVESVYRVADLRNLDENNPISVKIDSENAVATIVVVSYFEPWRGKYPVNVSWIDANPMSPNYKKIFKRVDKIKSSATPNWEHTWKELYYYKEVFVPPQYYDNIDGTDEFTAKVLAHIESRNNPHETTAAQVGSLPITGGTMQGSLVLYDDPDVLLEAATKRYVDNLHNQALSEILSLTDMFTAVSDKVTYIETSVVPGLASKVATAESKVTLLEQRVTTIEALNLSSYAERLTALEQVDITELQKIGEFGTRITTLENTVSSHDSSLIELSQFQQSASAKIVEHSSAIDSLQTSTNNLTTLVTNIQAVNTDQTRKIDEIVAINTQQDSKITSLQNDITALIATDNSILPRLGTVETQTANNTTDIAALTTTVNNYDARILTVENNIAQLQNVDVTELQAIAQYSTRLAALEANVTALHNIDTQQIAELTNLQPRVAALEEKDVQIDAVLLSQSVKIDSLTATNSLQDSKISALESTVNQYGTDIQNIIAVNTTQDSKIDAIIAVNTQQDSKIQAITADVENLKPRVTALELRADAIEAVNAQQNTHLEQIDVVNNQQNLRLDNLEIFEAASIIRLDALELSALNFESRITLLESFRVDTTQTLMITPKKFVHIQTVEATNWRVAHMLDSKDIAVTVSVGDEIVYPDTILIASSNEIDVVFNIPLAGRVVVTVF